MTQRHKHADILIAIAEGKTVQYNSLCNKDDWEDYNPDDRSMFTPLSCNDMYEWRVKPEVKKIEIISFINTNNGKICTDFYKENEFIDGKHVPYLKVLSRAVVEVPPETYDFYI